MTAIPLADTLSIVAIGANTRAGRWRTEAMRTHATPRLVVFSKGQGRVTVAGKTRGVGANNLLFLPAGTLYGIELGDTGYAQVITIPTAMAYEWPEEVCHLRLRDVAVQKELNGLFDHLERELQSHEPGASRAAHYRLALMAVFFERQLAARADTAPAPSASERLVQAYTALIAKDFRRHLGVADYAAALGVTPTHLTRCCKQSCGRSALSLLNDRKLFEARQLLRNSQLPIAQIASDLGYSSPAYFTRAFQAAEGATPSAFRARGPVQTA